MTAPVYSVFAPTNVALVAATSKVVLSALAGASFGLQIVGFDLGSLGVTATDVPIRVEVCKWDGTTPGTASAATPTQEFGEVMAPGFTSFYDYSVAPAALTVSRVFSLTPNSATLVYPFGQGEEIVVGPGDGIAIRLTAPANVNVVPAMRVQRV